MKTELHEAIDQFFSDKIAVVWRTQDVHRAANENRTVLTEAEALKVLKRLEKHYNKQHGLKWSELVECIKDMGLGRDIKRAELHRLLHKDQLTIDQTNNE